MIWLYWHENLKMNKLENVKGRLKWLQNIIENDCVLTEYEISYLKSAKQFCALAVEGCFTSISYNTLKKILAEASLTTFRAHGYESNLKYFLLLREGCEKKLVASKVSEAPRRGVYTVSDWKEFYRNALWHSNLCAEAYLSLRREVQALLKADAQDASLDYKRLEKIIKKSSATYLKLISAEAEPYTPELKLV